MTNRQVVAGVEICFWPIWDNIENANNVSEIHILKFKSKEVFPVQVQDNFRFPLAEGVLCQPEPMDHTWLRGPRKRVRPRVTETDDVTEEPEPKEENDEDSAGPSGEVPNAGGEAPRESPDSATVWDYWTMTDDLLTRHHKLPRSSLFVPSRDPALHDKDKCPIPIEYLDVMRSTKNRS